MTIYILYEKTEGKDKKCIGLTSSGKYALEWQKEDYSSRSWEVTNFLPTKELAKLYNENYKNCEVAASIGNEKFMGNHQCE